ncbi:MAG: putative Ig domain-containing protein, partial [Candidatus Thermoplasmatota archaeon]|nr:putative Ig domain-containing protein [Candidatus Thermoplasmatota archaeon]
CIALNDQMEPVVVVDSSGYSIISWVDDRGTDLDIYTQRMSPDGEIMWGENGTAVCTARQSQGNVDMLADGSGGAFMVWDDYRSKSGKDVYAKHTDADGVTYWMENGTAVITGSYVQAYPRLVEDGKGGIFITWEENFPDGYDIYARHIGMVITSTPETVFDEDSLPVFDMSSNEDVNATWSLSSDADCFWIDPPTGLVSGMPDNSHVGDHWINIYVENNEGMWDSLNFTVEVVNIPALITTLEPITTINEGAHYLFDLNSSDDGQGNVTWSLSTAAGWLSVNATSGVLSGVPENRDVGECTVNVSVSDGNGGLDYLIFNITVNNTNDAPTIQNQGPMNVTEDELFTLSLNATDVDLPGDVLTWNYTTSASWLGFNETSLVISGTPGNDDVGDYWINITVEDGRGGSDIMNITLIVENRNDAPIILTTELPAVSIDAAYSFEMEAVDIDPTNDTLIWSITTDATWLEINSTTGVLSGTPTEDDVGVVDIEITVSDGMGGEDVVILSLAVLGVNEPPMIDPVSPHKGVVGETYLLELSATDSNGDTLIWSMVTDADWLSINETTGALSGTPVQGIFDVTVTVDDGRGGSDTMALIIEIEPEAVVDDDDEGDYDADEKASIMPFIFIGALLLLVVVVVIVVLAKKGSSSDGYEE